MGVEVGASGLTADSVSQCRGGAGRPSSPYSTPSRLTCDSVVVMRGCTSARSMHTCTEGRKTPYYNTESSYSVTVRVRHPSLTPSHVRGWNMDHASDLRCSIRTKQAS